MSVWHETDGLKALPRFQAVHGAGASQERPLPDPIRFSLFRIAAVTHIVRIFHKPL